VVIFWKQFVIFATAKLAFDGILKNSDDSDGDAAARAKHR
jgi:hypothetical protein